MGIWPWLEMHFLAVRTKVHGTILAVIGCLGLLTALTHDIVGIHRFPLDGCSHHPGSEVIGGEILNSLLRNLERTMALWALDFPAARVYIKGKSKKEEEEEKVREYETKRQRRGRLP